MGESPTSRIETVFGCTECHLLYGERKPRKPITEVAEPPERALEEPQDLVKVMGAFERCECGNAWFRVRNIG